MLAEGKVGLQQLSGGAVSPARLGQSGELNVAGAHAPYMEPTYRGQCFYLDSDAVTLAAANTTKGALATIKLINGFYNPFNSGKLAVIHLAVSATTSGTPAGPLFYNYLTGVVVTSAATGTIRAAYLAGAAGSVMFPQVNVIVTVSGGATTALIQLGVHGGPAAVAAGAGGYQVQDYVDGRIIVPPGSVFGLAAVGAGTSHVVQSTLAWEEIPV